MYDPYMGTGYRNTEARDKRAQALSGRTVGFVAPGYPVEVGSPPSSPPPLAPVAAGGASGAAAVYPLAAAATAFGIGLGWWATSEVREWKRGHYRKSAVYRGFPDYEPLTSFNQDVDLSKSYDEAQVDQTGDFWAYPDGQFPETGWFRRGYVFCRCAGFPGTSNFRYDGTTFAKMRNNVGETCTTDTANCGGSFLPGFSASPDTIAEPFGPLIYFNVFYQHATLNRRIGTADYARVNAAKVQRWVQGAPGARVYPALGLTGLHRGHGSAEKTGDWRDWAAKPGTQPSDVARVDQPDRGTVVPFSLSHRFTRLVHVGGGPVTVPDQVYDPDTDAVTVHPPGHPPDYPDDSEEHEKKPWSQRMTAMGLHFINIVTETQDAMEALHQGLPKRLRSKGRKGGLKRRGDVPPWVIARDIIDHWDEFDGAKALEALINNEIEDRIYGRAFGVIGRTQKRAGISAGLRRGAATWHPVSLEVPEVHFADGGFSVSFGSVTIGG